ncbi:GGDEF domain-containing protein [Marinomonas sp. 2405UD68-3]|uniref:GGDEF domain-containing protein n=1 Tax=Marinomonas sp. 2405UD68-3 TaxID=3391835 RepID=UPI0039C9B410
MISRILHQYLHIDTSHPEYRHIAILLTSILVVAFGMVCFLALNIYRMKNPNIIVAHSISLTICCISLYLILKKQQIFTASMLFLLMITGLCSIVMVMIGNQSYALSIALVIPVISIFLLSFKWGVIYSTLYFMAFAWLCTSHLGIWQPATFTKISIMQLTSIYVILFAMACAYEFSRIESQKRLKETNEKLKDLAFTDMLTGLKNRRHLENILLSSTDEQFFAMIDIDDFKKINDLHGHDEGDRVLHRLAQIMNQSLGESSDVVRWGGEEFAILFHGDSQEDFINEIATMQEEIAHYDFGLNRPVTLSIGAGIFYPIKHKASLLAIDNALYQAKDSGKNCLKFSFEQLDQSPFTFHSHSQTHSRSHTP